MNDTDHNTDNDIWQGDLLGFAKRGDAFTSLITSIDDHRTISIEAGYGHGKTFFRQRWAKQLEAAGECVVEIDARLSDHSGDPVVTFLGALLKKIPTAEKSKVEKGLATGQRILMATGKAVAKATLREGANELAEVFEGEDGEASLLNDIAKSAGQDLSKAAGDIIAAQLSAEKAREELSQQLQNLHAQITEGRDTNRIIILIDELDRCHPDYAIALLEAMKLVFDQDGFVFVLMVNRDYLENIAAHRFGGKVEGEFYIDKFVDLRLKLVAEDKGEEYAARTLASDIQLKIPFGNHEAFGVARASLLAGEMAQESGLSMRQIKRVIDRIKLACHVYSEQPIDAPMLVWLAFHDGTISNTGRKRINQIDFQRAGLTESNGIAFAKKMPEGRSWEQQAWSERSDQELFEKFPEFETVEVSRYRSPNEDKFYFWARIYKHLAPHYIPEHQAMLDAVHQLQADV